MDRIEKFLGKLSPGERKIAEDIIERILMGDTDRLNIKKLRGYADIFRARKGTLRIIYRRNDSEVRLISVGNRDENTYRDF